MASEQTNTFRSGAWFMAAGLALLALATVPALGQQITAWELSLFNSINGGSDTWFVMALARVLSDFVWLLVFVAIATLLFWKGKRRWGWQLGAVIGISYVGAAIIEHIVQRGRPDAVLAADEMVSRAVQDGYGFPSGHEAAIAVAVLFFWRYLNWPLRIIGLLLIVGVGWSRIYLGVHFPLDILGGIAVGVIVVGAIYLLPAAWRTALHIEHINPKKPQK